MHDHDESLEALLSVERDAALPRPEFKAALLRRLREELHALQGTPPLPEALCPFERFCWAEQRLPRRLRANCPCLLAAPLLHALTARGVPLRSRPCPGLAARERAAVR